MTDNQNKFTSNFWSRIRRYFIAGLLITAPISLTLLLAWEFIELIDTAVVAIIPQRYHPESVLPFSIPGFGLLIVFVTLTAIGAFTAGLIGRLWLKFSENVLGRMPVIRSIYNALKQIFETVFSDTNRSFKDAVLVEYPKNDMWVIGFLTGSTKGEVEEKIGAKDLVNVFVPTTPNPTSGFLVFVDRSKIHDLDMSVEDALKLVISAGIVVPGEKNKTIPVINQPERK